MAEKKPSKYSNRGTVGSAEELDAYGVWVKSEPQDLTASMAETVNFDAEAVPYADFDMEFDASEEPEESSYDFGDLDPVIPEITIENDETDNFDDGMTASLSETPPEQGSEEASTRLLMKIADELSAIRSELRTLKKEFAGVHVEGAKAEAHHGGFFDGEEGEDEKITLTGDEMENILTSAAFSTEEDAGYDPQREADEAALKELSQQNESAAAEDEEEEEIKIDFDNLGIDLNESAETETEAEAHDDFPPLEAADDDDLGAPSFDELSLEDASPLAEPPSEELQEEIMPLEPLDSVEEDEELRNLRLEGASPFTPAPDNSVYLETDPFAMSDAAGGPPAAETFPEEITAKDTSSEEFSLDDTSSEEISFEDASSEEFSLDDTPSKEFSLDDDSSGGLSLEDIPPEAASAEELSLPDTPSEELSIPDASSEEISIEDTPSDIFSLDDDSSGGLSLEDTSSDVFSLDDDSSGGISIEDTPAPEAASAEELSLPDTPSEELSLDVSSSVEISSEEIALDDFSPVEISSEEISLPDTPSEETAVEEFSPEEVTIEDIPSAEAAETEKAAPQDTASEIAADLSFDDVSFDLNTDDFPAEEQADVGEADVSAESLIPPLEEPAEEVVEEQAETPAPSAEASGDDEIFDVGTPLDLTDAVIDEPDLSAGLVDPPLEEPVLGDISFGDDISLDMDDFGSSLDLSIDDSDSSGGSPAVDNAALDTSAKPDTAEELSLADDLSLDDLDAGTDLAVSPEPEKEETAGPADDSLTGVIPEGFEVNAEEAVSTDDDLETFADDLSIDSGDLSLSEPVGIAAGAAAAAKAAAGVAAGAAAGKAAGMAADTDADVDIPANFKSELKSVLSYMDHLLESLPEDKIEEFAKSEYFDSYKKIFKELGLV